MSTKPFTKMNSSSHEANDDQDWTPVVVKRRKPTATGTADYQSQNRGAGSAHLRIVADSDVPLPPPKRLSPESKTLLIQTRLSKKMTQEQLNKACNLPPGIINKIEAGHAQPSGTQLNIIARTLGVVLKFA